MTDDELYKCENVKSVSLVGGKPIKVICKSGERCYGCPDYEPEPGTDIDEMLD